MEPDELKAAWQDLGRRLERHDAINLRLLRESRLDKLRGSLRPLFWGQLLQFLLGIGLIALGVGCWTRNTGIPGLLAAGIVVHAFGALTAAASGITLGLMGSIDYSAPVLEIQKRFALLKRFYTLNGIVCGLPWWIMWVPVVVAFAGFGEHPPHGGTPLWIWINLGIGVFGLLATWGFYLWSQKSGHSRLAKALRDTAAGASLRRAQALLDEVREFERE